LQTEHHIRDSNEIVWLWLEPPCGLVGFFLASQILLPFLTTFQQVMTPRAMPHPGESKLHPFNFWEDFFPVKISLTSEGGLQIYLFAKSVLSFSNNPFMAGVKCDALIKSNLGIPSCCIMGLSTMRAVSMFRSSCYFHRALIFCNN
jgi:hypothetical protein